MTSSPWVRGVGVHSGQPAAARLHRTDDDAPIRFRRGNAHVEAHVANVVATPGCTVLGSPELRVAVVEHLLAALRLSGFWRGVLVEVDADELPILDGSAAPWQEPIAQLGDPPRVPKAWRIAAPIRVERAGGLADVRPGPRELDVRIDFPHPSVGAQSWRGDPDGVDAAAALANARTFGFLDQVEALRASGRARGAGLDNAIVFGDTGPLRPMRHADEPVRHKALDALGDLALVQRPIDAHVRIERGSHELHVALARAVLAADAEIA